MSVCVRETIENAEREHLSSLAARASESSGRVHPEDPDPVRTCFQRDRDRILHSKPFRRLKHKTQVFIEPMGDHFRTRMTHTLEVAQIARTISRALRLNEDLTEAIALGHDVGHTPFGHAGESALDEVLVGMHATGEAAGTDAPTQFRHYEQSLRVVDILTPLNLTHETRAGIGGHSKGRKDLTDSDGEPTSTLEAAVVRISDRIAYMNHDLDDALRSGMVKEIPTEFAEFGPDHSRRIGRMVEDVILNSLDSPSIRMSPSLLTKMNILKEWLFDHVYMKYPLVYPDIPKAKAVVQELFRFYCQQDTLPPGYTGIQGAVDYVAGMTDRFAMDTFAELRLPSGFRVSR